MRPNPIIYLILFLFLNGSGVLSLSAQNALGNKPLRVYWGDDKTQWLQFSSYIQLWGRVNQNNPGSTVNDKLQTVTTDISIRRFRLGLSAAPWEKTYVSFQLGVNNLNYLSPRGTSVDLLDAYVQYDFSKYLGVGGGKSAWNGLSRFTSPSSSKLMGYDLNFVALPTLDSTDDLIRKLSLYVKGKIGAIDYRLVLAKPLSVQNSRSFNPEPVEDLAQFTDNQPNLQYSGYLKYEFWEPESNMTPFHTGTYLGKKKILNLGVGFTLQADALWSLQNGEKRYHDMKLFATDVFLDVPLDSDKKRAVTAYLGYFNFNFGTNYIRLLGANNPANGVRPELASFNGRGNTFPVSGTGEAVSGQLGFLFPTMGIERNMGRLQPYILGQYSDFDALAEPIFQYDLGINWYFNEHLSKLTFNAQQRPILFDLDDGIKTNNRKWMFVLQYQIRLD